MHQLANRVVELEKTIDAMKTIAIPMNVPHRIQVGVCVEIYYENDDREASFFIAGFQDGDPNFGRVSYTSPIGQSLLGLQIGESAELNVGGNMQSRLS